MSAKDHKVEIAYEQLLYAMKNGKLGKKAGKVQELNEGDESSIATMRALLKQERADRLAALAERAKEAQDDVIVELVKTDGEHPSVYLRQENDYLRRRQFASLGTKPELVLRDMILRAAHAVGVNDGKGSGGLIGYLMLLASEYPKTYAQLLLRVLPKGEKETSSMLKGVLRTKEQLLSELAARGLPTRVFDVGEDDVDDRIINMPDDSATN
jgi:hypothetical protein